MRPPLGGRTALRHARNGRLRIAYRVDGPLLRRGPWLLLIQGLGFDHTGWDPVVPALRRHFRLLLMDNRGYGGSDRGDRMVAVPDLAADALAVLDHAGVARAHVAGASLGGMVAQELAIGHPDRVDRLVLACTTPGWPSGYPMPGRTLRLMARLQNLPPQQARRLLVENALAPRTVRDRPELVARLVRRQPARGSGGPPAWMALNLAGARFYGGGRQARIRARTLILQGTEDAVVDPRNGRWLADHIPAAELSMLPGLGHLFFWEDPESFTGPVTAFLRGRRVGVVHTGP